MIIKDIHLAGFKHFSPQENLDIRNISSERILSLRGENKRFLFKTILAIIFGMHNDEHGYFRSPEHDTVFTGRITLRYEKNDIFIERDFLTGIIAVLSNGKKPKSIFQGKTLHNLPGENDPYQDFLQSIFSFVKKDELLGFCLPLLEKNSIPLGEALNRLYLFLRPKFNMALLERNEKRTLFFLQNVNGELVQKVETTQSAKIKLKLYALLRQIDQGIKNIEHDKYLLEEFLALKNYAPDTEMETYGMGDLDRQKKQLVLNINNYQNAFKQQQTFETQLDKLKLKRNQIKTIISKELLVYADLPVSFIEDFYRYQELTTDLSHQKIEYDRKNIQVLNLIDDMHAIKRSGILYSSLIGISILLTGMLLKPEWGIINAFIAAVALITTAAFFKRKKSFSLNLIDTKRRQQMEIRQHIKNCESELGILRDDAFLLDDFDSIDEHISNFKRYKKLHGNLKQINGKINHIEQGALRGTIDVLEKIENRYPGFSIQKPVDKKHFLERLKSELATIEQKKMLSISPEEHIRKIILQYADLAKRLKIHQKKLLQKLPADLHPDRIAGEVQRLNRFIVFKTSGYDIIP